MATTLAEQVAALDVVLATVDAVRSASQRDRRAFHDDPWPLFVRKMRLLTPQAYGTRMQNRLAEHFGWQVIPASVDRGDVTDSDGNYHEVKVTMITASNPKVNFVQLRPHQDVAGYHLFVVEDDYTLVHLWLSAEQMATELHTSGRVAHGTRAANVDNVNQEYVIRFVWDRTNEVTTRWLATYQLPAPHLG